MTTLDGAWQPLSSANKSEERLEETEAGPSEALDQATRRSVVIDQKCPECGMKVGLEQDPWLDE